MPESLLTYQSVSRDNLIAGDNQRLITESVVIATGNLAKGSLIGKITKSCPTTGTADAGNTGNGTMTRVTAGSKAKVGTYTAILKSLDGGTLTSPTTGTAGTNTGNGTMTSVTAGTKAQAGTYTITCISKSGGTITVPSTGTAGTNSGGGTCGSVTGGAAVKCGVYRLTCIEAASEAGIFQVQDPDGYLLPRATVGVAYTSSQINFTLADGTPDFSVGDVFTITTTNGGLFSVVAPDGKSLPNAPVGVYTNAQINFTISDGSTDFVVGDLFTVSVGNAGLWEVRDPDGLALLEAKTGVAYTSNAINFTINDGSTDFAVADKFTVAVAAGSLKYKLAVSSAVDGSQDIETMAVLGEAADASSTEVTTIAYIAGEFNQNAMTFGSGFSASSVKEKLAQRGIFLKNSLTA